MEERQCLQRSSSSLVFDILQHRIHIAKSIIQRFGVGKGTGIKSVRHVAKALCELSNKYIVWPKENEIEDIVHGFSRIKDFPDSIGAIDGTYIVVILLHSKKTQKHI